MPAAADAELALFRSGGRIRRLRHRRKAHRTVLSRRIDALSAVVSLGSPSSRRPEPIPLARPMPTYSKEVAPRHRMPTPGVARAQSDPAARHPALTAAPDRVVGEKCWAVIRIRVHQRSAHCPVRCLRTIYRDKGVLR